MRQMSARAITVLRGPKLRIYHKTYSLLVVPVAVELESTKNEKSQKYLKQINCNTVTIITSTLKIRLH